MRKVKSYLHHERRRKTWMGRTLSIRIFDDIYWKWSEKPVATGAAWGAASAICPLPMQSFWGIAACLWRKGNIPVAVLMAWLSPPGSFLFLLPTQWWLGSWIFAFLGFPSSGASLQLIQQCVDEKTFQPLAEVHYGLVLAEFGIGATLSCASLGILVYGIVRGVWRCWPSSPPNSDQENV